MLNLNSIMLGSAKPEELAKFYEKVLEKKPDMAEGQWFGFSAGACFISIGFHDKVTGKSQNPERIIFNFATKEVEAEFKRIKALGATVITEPYSMPEDQSGTKIATLADPDGNYFQIMTPWEPQK
jgi:predicted enzyme related to lactoylglutathione lyase